MSNTPGLKLGTPSRTDRLRLHPGVFYRPYDSFVALFHTGARKVFTFNLTSSDIFDCFKDYCSIEDALAKLKLIYAVDNAHEFETSVCSFIDDAVDKGILQLEYKQSADKDNLESRISSSFSGTNQLYSATIELTYRCNEKCRHCFIVDERRPELSADQFNVVLDQLAGMGVLNVVFTGGEVFLRKDAFDILEHAYAKGFAIDIFTNGALLDGNDYIRLKAIWPRCVHFSIYSHIAEKHDAITKVTGSFDKTLKSIKACSLIGIPVNIKTTVFQETVDDVAGLIHLAESLGSSIEVGRGIIPKKNGDLSVTALQVTDAEDYRKVSAVINDHISEVNCVDSGRSPEDRICGAGEHSISINPYGEVYPCNTLQLNLGTVASTPLMQIWQESTELKWWRKNNYVYNRKGCDGCELISRCIFCPGEAMMRTGDPLQMYQGACMATHLANDSKAYMRSEEGR